MHNNIIIISALVTLTVYFAAPSLLLDLVDLGSFKSPIGQVLLILCFVVLATFNNARFSRTTFLVIGLVLIYGFGLMLIYSLAGLSSSVKPIFGATIKVVLFVLFVDTAKTQRKTILKSIKISMLPLLAFVLLANLAHNNITGLDELVRIVVDERQISVLMGSLSSSRLFIEGNAIYRTSSIFNEPGTHAFILYCLFLVFVTARELSKPIQFVLAINFLSTFSLGGYVSGLVAAMAYLNFRSILTRRWRAPLISIIAFLSVAGSALYFFAPAISLVLLRLTRPTDGRMIAGDNRFFDDRLPQNYWLGDGSYGGGFDSVISVFQQFGILGCLILFAPVITVAVLLFRRQQFAFGLALLLFLSHKPNILSPVILILLAFVASRLSQHPSKC